MISSRQSPPPGPPGPFNPNLIVQPASNAAQQAAQEHIRLRPEDKQRPLGAPFVPTQLTHIGGPAPTPKPYVHQSYPGWRFHPTKKAIIVNDPDQEAILTPAKDGWVKSRGLLPPDPAPGLDDNGKFALLSDLLSVLDEQIEPNDIVPVRTLMRIISERDDFARKYAAIANLTEPKESKKLK